MRQNISEILGMLSIVMVIAFISLDGARATYTEAELVTSGGSISDLHYILSGKSYVDNVGVNPDIKVRVYSDNPIDDLTGKWVTIVYKTGDSYFQIASGGVVGTNMTQLGARSGSGPYYSDSPLTLNTLSAYAIYPANVYIVVSDDKYVSLADSFVLAEVTNGMLLGSYSTNTVPSTYNQVSGNVTFRVTGIAGDTGSGSYNILTDHPSNSELVVGICGDHYGISCSSSAITKPNTDVNLYTGVMPSAAPQFKYYVVNGMGTQFCIGSNLIVSVGANSTNPRSGQSVNITATITNDGNVDAGPFNIQFYDGPTLLDTISIPSLSASSSISRSINYDTTGKAGLRPITVNVDTGSAISECNEGDNSGSIGINIRMGYWLRVFIDGVESTVFNDSGRPYNITLNVTNSVGAPVGDAIVKIIEKNGMSLLAPTQIWQEGGQNKSVVSYSMAEVRTNSSGLVSFTLVPTGNKMMVVNPDVKLYTGNYSLSAELYVGGSLEDMVQFTVNNLSATTPNLHVNSTNKENVDYVYDVAYQIFSTVKGWFTF